ncbi:hypothetical protein, partial [Enterobacter hormaechei]|uniref:hypothetical protein n=1 Tax=Enterobacter hormaechei TaxID=158836 RepID=UPI0022EC86C6
ILCVVHAAIRREGLPAFSASGMTAGELVAALQMAREVGEAGRVSPEARTGTGSDVSTGDAATAADENVTPLSTARHTK